MIKINIQKEHNVLKNISISGHAMYDNIGKDIVCSAVSSIVICSINAIIMLNEDSIIVNQEDNKIEIKILNYDEITNKLLLNMMNLLKEIKNNYPKNIKIKEVSL
ncbi:MAG: ribosomal-processing cysteine protease Prp [bacterium]|nr:ribosomal-processing cysteine protease Prp [bacterium]